MKLNENQSRAIIELVLKREQAIKEYNAAITAIVEAFGHGMKAPILVRKDDGFYIEEREERDGMDK